MEYPVRLDVYLTKKNIAESRSRGQALIGSGQVYLNNINILKSSHLVKENDRVEIKGSGLKYVSRGGLKLEKAIYLFNINLIDKVCVDIGASTGGFTDCMLQNGAEKVYAIDVGTGQLAERLLKDIRVVNIEKTNIRSFDSSFLENEINFIAADVSFISLKYILPVIKKINYLGKAVVLVKPQFEVGSKNIGRNGVVASPKLHLKILEKIYKLSSDNGLRVANVTFSPIKGPKGNIEYLFYLDNENIIFNFNDLEKIIYNAFYRRENEDTISAEYGQSLYKEKY